MGLVIDNPATDVKRPRNRQPAPRGLELGELGELRRLLDVIPDTSGGKRDRAIILTAALAGLRRQELIMACGRGTSPATAPCTTTYE